MSFTRLIYLAVMGLIIVACGNQDPSADSSAQTEQETEDRRPLGDNSEVSLDWDGTYLGIVPCASCEGIRTRIALNSDGTFERSITHLGESPVPETDSGTFEWNDAGSAITLRSDADGPTTMYQVGENVLFQLDQEGNRITGDLADRYRLEKTVSDPAIEDKRWVLTELQGQPYEAPEGERESFILLSGEEGRVAGFAMCNNFTGTYDLLRGNRIRFSPNMAATMMACPQGDREAEFMEMLRTVDNYSISTNTMTLNRARMAPLAQFTLAED